MKFPSDREQRSDSALFRPGLFRPPRTPIPLNPHAGHLPVAGVATEICFDRAQSLSLLASSPRSPTLRENQFQVSVDIRERTFLFALQLCRTQRPASRFVPTGRRLALVEPVAQNVWRRRCALSLVEVARAAPHGLAESRQPHANGSGTRRDSPFGNPRHPAGRPPLDATSGNRTRPRNHPPSPRPTTQERNHRDLRHPQKVTSAVKASSLAPK